MKYQAYPEYKDSGVEWLGEVPAYWRFARFKFFANVQKGKLPKKIVADEDGKFPPYLTMDYLRTGYPENFVDDKSLVPINDGEVLLLWDGANAGEFIKSRYGVISSTVAHIKFISQFNHRFCWYLVKSLEIELRTSTIGMGIPHVSGEKLNNLIFYEPLFLEQQQIANFLDHETAKIDTLIEKQQQLIKLLKEKRQAVISHAVTKGLNPNAPMRDSGVEWLGEVPEHWIVAQLKFNTVEMQTGPFGSQLHAEDYIDDGIPLVNPAHMTDGKIVPDLKVSVDEETWHRLKRHQLFEGDLILARRGELGRCAIVTKKQEGWICGTGSLKAKLNNRLIPEYSYLLITSDGVVSELSLESKGSTMDNLNTEALGRVRLPVPPVDEQRKILDYVNDVSGKFRNLIDKASSAIALIQERRSALISAAVTGKIDVRHWNGVSA